MAGWTLLSNGAKTESIPAEKILAMAEAGKLAPDAIVGHAKHTKGKLVAAEQIPAFAKRFAAGAERREKESQAAKQAQREEIRRKKQAEKAAAAAKKEQAAAEKAEAFANAPFAAFLGEGQSPAIIEKTYGKVTEILMAGEEVEYMAVAQHLAVPGLQSPDCAVATNRRFLVVRPKMLGRLTFDDYRWVDLHDAKLKQGVMFASISFETDDGEEHEVEYLPKPQARKLYGICQRREEDARDERRQKELEERRAASGAINITTPVSAPAGTAPSPATAADDPVERLAKLKKMLEADLIGQAEFDRKKAEVLASM